MPTNILLIRWQGGWHERPVPDTDLENLLPRRIEGTLGLGAAQSVQEVDRIADRQLEIFKNARVAITADIEPNIAPLDPTRTPYLGFQVGDTQFVGPTVGEAVEHRVNSVTVSEDDQGVPSYAVVWGDQVIAGVDAFYQWLKKMANGTLAGQSKPATPVSQITNNAGNACPPVLPAPSSSGGSG